MSDEQQSPYLEGRYYVASSMNEVSRPPKRFIVWYKDGKFYYAGVACGYSPDQFFNIRGPINITEYDG